MALARCYTLFLDFLVVGKTALIAFCLGPYTLGWTRKRLSRLARVPFSSHVFFVVACLRYHFCSAFVFADL